MTAQVRVYNPQSASRASPGAVVPGLFRRLALIKDRADLVKQVNRGFRVAVVEKLAEELELFQQALLKVVRIAPATLARRWAGTPRWST